MQTVTVGGSPTTWSLIYNAVEPTSGIHHPASAATIVAALEALPSINVGDVAVSNPVIDGTTYTYDVSFQGQFTTAKVPEMTGSINSGGTDPYVTVATTTDGAARVTDTDYQITSITIEAFFQFPFPDAAFIDLWARRDDNDNSPTGIRLRIGPQWIRLSSFIGGVELWGKQYVLIYPPYPGEKWTLITGVAGAPRTFLVRRHGSTLVTYKESGTGSALGAAYRGGGIGMNSGDGLLAQNIPPAITDWNLGDNASIAQSGHLTLTNFGDQPAWPSFVVYGPGTFSFSNGPGAEPTITFGPLTEGQIALVETHPGKRGVYDISVDVPQSDTMYALLNGRWSNSIPARTLGATPTSVQMAVEIEGGDYDSRVIASITPQCRWPT